MLVQQNTIGILGGCVGTAEYYRSTIGELGRKCWYRLFAVYKIGHFLDFLIYYW